MVFLAASTLLLLFFRFGSVVDFIYNIATVFHEPHWADGLETPEHVLEYLLAHRDDCALLVADVDPAGDLTAGALRHNTQEAMPTASLLTLPVLAAWSAAVAGNRANPEERVPVAAWEGHHLPSTDGGAHRLALEDLGIDMDEKGRATDGTASVPARAIVHAMVRFSDHSATDWVLDQLPYGAVEAILSKAGINGHGPINPIAPTILSWRNHENRDQDPSRLESMAAQSTTTQAAAIRVLTERWADPRWRENELAWRRDDMSMGRLSFQSAAADRLFPAATANTYGTLLAKVATDTFLSEQVSAQMRSHLEWPLQEGRNSQRFASFGTQGGNLPGVLVEGTWAISRTGSLAGRTRLVVLFLRRMPMSAWLRLMDTFAQRYFVLRVATDEKFARLVQERLGNSETSPEP